ncbi:MAG: 3-deoxy-manno-octulosonate cytidylyltransferase [Syntrophobacterales bacterium]|jgi:3-deoxy-manno-octulosonate cytidylyltransferase (CMP-KDO synthetase)|nr:3-deoxy-manno-octulosonate cytidylyltransferase [Syntrophobacterales bacterium]
MRKVALIPARYGSSRFPGKPLAPILGKPLIQWTYEQALRVKGLDGVWVATDDTRIKECVETFGGRVVMTRDDHPSGSDRLAEAATLLNLAPEDIVINIQGDQPVFPVELIRDLAARLSRDPAVVMVTPARKLSDPAVAADPNVVKVVFDHAGRALYFSRSPLPFWRDRDTPYFYKHVGIYAYRVQFLKEFVHLPPGRWEAAEKLEQLRALEHGFPIHIVETEGDTREVDTPEDLRQAEAYLALNS